MDPNPDEEDMEDVRLDNKREHQQRMVFKNNGGGMDDDKALIHDKR